MWSCGDKRINRFVLHRKRRKRLLWAFFSVSLIARSTGILQRGETKPNDTILSTSSAPIVLALRKPASYLEIWHIYCAPAPLNRDNGGFLPYTYLRLFNRNNRWLVSIWQESWKPYITLHEDRDKSVNTLGLESWRFKLFSLREL